MTASATQSADGEFAALVRRQGFVTTAAHHHLVEAEGCSIGSGVRYAVQHCPPLRPRFQNLYQSLDRSCSYLDACSVDDDIGPGLKRGRGNEIEVGSLDLGERYFRHRLSRLPRAVR